MNHNPEMQQHTFESSADIIRVAEELKQCEKTHKRIKEIEEAMSQRPDISPEILETIKKAAAQQLQDEVYDVIHRYTMGEFSESQTESKEETFEEETETREKAETGPKKNVKKLFRSNKDKMISGVCGGLAEYLNIDSTIVRVAFVILTVFYFLGLIAYIALLCIVPQRED